MDKLQWFKFSYADWRMGKIQRCPEITQARFMNLCCLYWSKEAELSIEDAEIEVDKEHLDILIAKKVIEEDGKFIFIKFLDEQLDEITETSKGKSKAAKARWDKYREEKAAKELEDNRNAQPMHVHTDAMQTSAEERRGEERREETKLIPPVEKTGEDETSSLKNQSPPQEIKKEKSSAKKEKIDWDWIGFIKYINKHTGRKFQVVNDKVRENYLKTLKQGYTKESIMSAIENAPKAQNHIDNGCQHLTPEFFSRPDKIDMYSSAVSKPDSENIKAPKMNAR